LSRTAGEARVAEDHLAGCLLGPIAIFPGEFGFTRVQELILNRINKAASPGFSGVVRLGRKNEI